MYNFDPYKFDSTAFTADAIKQIDRDFAQGAVAAKVWKNIGMEIKNGNGEYVMADDPKFVPIYKDIASHGKTLIDAPSRILGPATPIPGSPNCCSGSGCRSEAFNHMIGQTIWHPHHREVGRWRHGRRLQSREYDPQIRRAEVSAR